MTQGVFIVGTDTGVGKTRVATALLRAWVRRGLRVAGMKPVAAGAVLRGGVLRSEDAEALVAAANVEAPWDWINPYCFAPPVAPHIAAMRAGVSIDMTVIRDAYHRLAERAERVVVEGAGGLLVPLSGRADMASIAQELEIPVILVVGMRLGCLNHALLTAQAIAARGLALVGWVANSIDPAMEERRANLAWLQGQLAAPCLGCLPYADTAQNWAMDWSALDAVFRA